MLNKRVDDLSDTLTSKIDGLMDRLDGRAMDPRDSKIPPELAVCTYFYIHISG